MEPLAKVTILEDSIELHLEEKLKTSFDVLSSYMDQRELQYLILQNSFNKKDFEVLGPNVIIKDNTCYLSNDSLWIEKMIKGDPVSFAAMIDEKPSERVFIPST